MAEGADLLLTDAAATEALGRALAARLVPGDTVLLDGPIGAGKTALARAVIQALLAESGAVEEVPSPTFTLVQAYDTARGEVLHADLYRLGGPAGLDDIGLTDALGRAICLIEWPDRLGALAPAEALSVALRPGPTPDSRRARLAAAAPRWRPVLAALPAETGAAA